MTRVEHHADSSADTVRESRRTVREALETFCVGRAHARSGREIAEKVPVKYTTTRDIIAELRDDPDGPPIGNCGAGYFIIDTEAELEAWLDTKRGEIQTARNRMEANVQAFNRRQA